MTALVWLFFALSFFVGYKFGHWRGGSKYRRAIKEGKV